MGVIVAFKPYYDTLLRFPKFVIFNSITKCIFSKLSTAQQSKQ